MASRRPEGAALLVAGHGAPGVGAFDASAVHTLGQIGEALLATGTAWQIRRLTATAGDRNAADRATLKRTLDDMVSDPVRVTVVVLLGAIVDVGGALALVTGQKAPEYPEDTTLPLSWIGERLRATKAEHMVVAISGCGDGNPAAWLAALGTGRSQDVIAIDAPNVGNPMLDALLTGLCGDALDPRTGTVTMASLSDHLGKHAKALQPSAASETVAQPPPLAGLWDVRRSQLTHRVPKPRGPGEQEDLTGAVLPGRFRLDRVVARGTFGTVYRARQLAVERDVAVKVLHADIDPASEDGRLFVHEIRSVGRIDHSNVVRIYQADITHDGRLFFAMELLGGSDLQQLGAAGTLPTARAVELVRQLLAGLGAAHDAGLVHADIKPANAIVIPRGATPEDGERVVLVDFGLARLRALDQPAESAGGTPAYMAPEQLHEGRVDARSDLFSVALVLVWLTTGWRRPNAFTLAPPPEVITDPDLSAVLARALDHDPAKRFQSAAELAAALGGKQSPQVAEPTAILPFRHLAPLTEHDRDRLHGRESDLAVITEHVLYRRSVVYTAPSGTGKTSLLRAGLVPRLESLGIRVVYVRSRVDGASSLATDIAPGTTSLAEAITSWHAHHGGKLVIIVDQLEAALGESQLVSEILAFDRWPATADVSIVLSIREDYLARLLARSQELEPGMPIVRLPPLMRDGARTAIVAPLTESRLAIEPELLDALLADLERAAAAIGPEMGWGNTLRAVFPPHLQLACSVLYEALGPGERTLTLAHYRRLGGFDAIVGEHLDRVIETELANGLDVIARDLFVALVTTAHERANRPESELLAIVGAKHGEARVTSVLEVLRSRGLLVRVRGDTEPSWELIHDSLVPRVLAWIDRKDLDRRRAIELVRYHLRRSRLDAPSLLDGAELRELRSHQGALEELEDEWKTRDTQDAWTPRKLVDRSRTVLRRRTATLTTVVLAALAVASVGMYRSHVEEERGREQDRRAREQDQRAREQDRLKSLDLGRFVLSLEPFEWDHAQRAVAVAPREPLRWELRLPKLDEPDAPGDSFDPTWIVHGTPRIEGNAMVEHVEAHGGRAYLVISRPGCAPSVVPLRQLPGFAHREQAEPTLHVRTPTCEATSFDMVTISGGPFVYGGLGEPASKIVAASDPLPAYAIEKIVELPAYRIDRLEVTNAEFAVFASMDSITGVAAASYPNTSTLPGVGDPYVPVTGLDWFDARAYCRYLGKELPTTEQWTKALRGGQRLSDGSPNPLPRRSLPWGRPIAPTPAKVSGVGPRGPAAVGSHPGDRSPDGVLDLAGNVTEWTTSSSEPRIRIVRGGNWEDTPVENIVDYDIAENPRAERQRLYSIGLRCAASDSAQPLAAGR